VLDELDWLTYDVAIIQYGRGGVEAVAVTDGERIRDPGGQGA
jgi:hypothetical protein